MKIRASTVKDPCCSVPTIDWPKIQNRWDHLKDLPLKKTRGRIDLLIGLDFNDYIITRERRLGGEGEPTASRSKFGWVARGPVGNEDEGKLESVNFANKTENRRFEETFTKFYSDDSYGTELKIAPRMSADDNEVMDFVTAHTKALNPGFQVPLI